ncbi:hypothetical protein VNO78_34295 [Psophocarpus tetragonolobus]|uniref:MLO-like protein n=1 Tax=Psophocarpus tetragonolobus TaxID=3891 RepID=A0AAN9RNW3_PSOTE
MGTSEILNLHCRSGEVQVSFFRQFYGSVNKVDYMALRYGFIVAHLTPASEAKFDFQNYIRRTLDEDFAVVVGIRPRDNLVGGNKATNDHNRDDTEDSSWGEVVKDKGAPVVEPGDELVWFNRPRLVLFLIQLCLFQNAFQLAFFAWSTYDNGFKINSCFHRTTANIVIRLTMGVLTQVLCSYVTLPLYALVTQMGSTMKPTIFNDNVAAALKNWRQTARKQIKQNKNSASNTPFSNRPGTPTHDMSPVHLLHKHPRQSDSPLVSPRASNYENEQWDVEGLHSPSYHARDNDHEVAMQMQPPTGVNPIRTHHEINVALSEFSFGRRQHINID